MATLSEIAREAGVSSATVSNVINGKLERVSPATVERVQALIRKHNYIPNESARSLSSRASRVIALVVQSGLERNALSDPYNAEFVGTTARILQRYGYHTLLYFSDDFADIDRSLRSWNAQGAVFTGTTDRHIRAIPLQSSIPLVFTDSYSSTRHVNNIGIDDFKGGRLVAEYLLARGHRSMAFVAPGFDSSEVDLQRCRGFATALHEAGVDVPPECFLQMGDTPLETARSICSLSTRVSAVFATSDKAAIDVIAGLQKLDKRVPEDYSVIGFDGLPVGEYITPPLTTISQDILHKAHMVVELLLRHIAHPNASVENLTLDVKLLERGSVCDHIEQ